MLHTLMAQSNGEIMKSRRNQEINKIPAGGSGLINLTYFIKQQNVKSGQIYYRMLKNLYITRSYNMLNDYFNPIRTGDGGMESTPHTVFCP